MAAGAMASIMSTSGVVTLSVDSREGEFVMQCESCELQSTIADDLVEVWQFDGSANLLKMVVLHDVGSNGMEGLVVPSMYRRWHTTRSVVTCTGWVTVLIEEFVRLGTRDAVVQEIAVSWRPGT